MKRGLGSVQHILEMTPWPVRVDNQLRQAFTRIASLEAEIGELKDRLHKGPRLFRRKARKAVRS